MIAYRNVTDGLDAYVEQTLQTLRLLPDDIVLAVAGREIEPSEPSSCLCGWAMREGFARVLDQPASELRPLADPSQWLAVTYGGSYGNWDDIFLGITDQASAPLIEEAFTFRVLECV